MTRYRQTAEGDNRGWYLNSEKAMSNQSISCNLSGLLSNPVFRPFSPRSMNRAKKVREDILYIPSLFSRGSLPNVVEKSSKSGFESRPFWTPVRFRASPIFNPWVGAHGFFSSIGSISFHKHKIYSTLVL